MTLLTRALPFLIFKGETTPGYIFNLGKALPPAVIGMLIVYCIKSVDVTKYPFAFPEVFAIAVTALLHIWKRNNLISILGGTALYMVMVQVFF
jgi:branched-subunit amino acid transport protein AzlD